ncbi:hypothetical protein M3P21_17195 [Ruegeria sp. 2012CJ41-6]|uniref:Asparagine synthetase domain-containing protein n=1 Tax=Ruegeria spongiae TaxID=2942209 RepID=A0ABT0Q6S7_9RHOB|nr:hypothetical protein [Ruegeria spongiae]MCL6285267.1 hypothetical protein [Ruegeria spongiae]
MATEAVRLCTTHDLPFNRLFRYQYVLARTDLALPGFSAVQMGGFVLQTGQDLPCHTLVDMQGRSIGYVFGQAVTHAGVPFAQAVAQLIDAQAEDARDRFEDLIVHTVGRFGILADLGGGPGLYQDASGVIGAVENADLGRIASSLNLCLDRPVEKSPLFVDADTDTRHCVCGLSFTEDAAVARINPSYRFDLTAWQGDRFWPREGDLFEHPAENYAQALDEIIDSVRAVTRRMTMDHPVVLSLSGGYDSRAIYAISDLETRGRFAQIFAAVHNRIGWYDAMVASSVCGLDGLGLEIHQTARPRRFSTAEQLDKDTISFSVASGKTGIPPIETQLGSWAKIRDNGIVMRGQQIPILKALFVRERDPKAWTPEFLVGRVATLLRCGAAPEDTRQAVARATLDLQAGFPTAARARIVDLLLMEAINGPELTEMFTGFSHAFYTSPFNSRRLIQLFAGFDTSHRANLSTFHHLLMRADARTCGIATAGQVKQVKGWEEDGGIVHRYNLINQYSESYAERVGEPAPPVQLRRFSTFGAVGVERPRNILRLAMAARRA